MAFLRNPVVYVPDLTNGRPIVDGKVYVLVAGTVPPTHDSAIDPLTLSLVSYENEAGNIVEVPQPLYTSKGGCLYGLYPEDARQYILASDTYVFAVYDKQGRLQYSGKSDPIGGSAYLTLVQEDTPSLTGISSGTRWYKPSEATNYIAFVDTDSSQWVQEPVADAFIDSSKSSGFITPEDFGAVGDGVTDDTAALQAAIDYCAASDTTKTVRLNSVYYCGPSALTEVYSNTGVEIPASSCAVVLRKGVNLVGSGIDTSGLVGPKELILLAPVAPRNQKILNFSIKSNWLEGQSGAGHGIFTLSTEGGADNELVGLEIGGMYIERVASYGIALQNGQPTGCYVHDCETYYTGADGFDLKARNDEATIPESNTAERLTARRFNMRLDGSSGVDVRGVWNLFAITVKDFGENAAKTYTGIRFRTKPPLTDPYNKAAAKSTLFGFDIKSDNVGTVNGVSSGSDDVKIHAGTIENIANGVYLEGNAVGSATRNLISAVTVINATSAGFKNLIGTASNTFDCCYAVNCVIGFRIEGAGTKIGSCEADGSSPLSIAATSLPTTSVNDCKFGDDSQVKIYQVAAGRVGIEAIGASTDIDIALTPKGAGLVRIGTNTATADAPITSYITIKDSAGVLRKLAVIS